MSRNGTPMQRLRDRTRVSVAPERISYLRERGVEIQAESAVVVAAAAEASVDGLADGTTPFTGLNVGGVQVKPFLDQTDGTKLTDSAGLDAAIVSTPKVEANAITSYVAAYTDGTLSLSGTTFVTIQTVTFTTTGEPLEIRANFFLNVHHPAAGGISARIRIVQSTPFGGNLFDQEFAAIGDDFLQGWQTPTINVTPAAGTYTYDLIVSLSTAGAAVETVQSRLLSVQEFKR